MKQRYLLFQCVLMVCAWTALACQSEPPEPHGLKLQTLTEPSHTLVIPWGNQGVSRRVATSEDRGFGPQSATVMPCGDLVILDNLAGRLLRVDRKGSVMSSFDVPPTASDVACSQTQCVLLDLTRPVLVAVDMVTGERFETRLSVAFKTAVGIDWVNGTMRLSTVHQESMDAFASSPLSTRTNGVLTQAGKALSVRLEQGRMTVLEEVPPLLDGARRQATPLFGDETTCRSLRVIGAVGATVGLLCERLEQGPHPEVSRAVQLFDLSGRLTQELALQMDSLYLPFRGVRFVNNELLTIRSTAHGLQLVVRPLGGAEVSHD